jgi:uncharacterized protein (TIGR02996 family)
MDTEAMLLARVADGDDDARAVLADWWIEHGDEPRGRFVQFQLRGADATALWDAHGDAWLAPLTGYPREHLTFERGFLRYPLVLPSAIDRELFRLSPRAYRVVGARHAHMLEARAASCAGEGDLVLIAPAVPEQTGRAGTTDELGQALYRDWRAVVMPPGVDLRQLVAARPRPGLSCALSVAAAICDRLSGPHARGALHGMLQRENVLLVPGGGIVLARAAMARLSDRVDGETFDFLAPEQTVGRAEPRSDVFAIGMIACWLATGEHPVEQRATDFAALMAIRNGQYRIPSFGLPALDRVLRRALAHRPEDRYGTAGELATALRAAATVEVGPRVIAAVVKELA